jgi:hypothetical protein
MSIFAPIIIIDSSDDSSSDSVVGATTDTEAVIHIPETSDDGDSTTSTQGFARARSLSPGPRVPLRRQMAMGMLQDTIATSRLRRSLAYVDYAAVPNASFFADFNHPGDDISSFADDDDDEDDEGDEGDEGDDAATTSSIDSIAGDSTYSYGDLLDTDTTLACDASDSSL